MSSRLHPLFNQKNFTNSMPHQRMPLGNDRGLQQAIGPRPPVPSSTPSVSSSLPAYDSPTSGPWPDWYENSPVNQGTHPGGPNSRVAPAAAAAVSSGGGGSMAAGAGRLGSAGKQGMGQSQGMSNGSKAATLAGKALSAGLDYATQVRDNKFQAHIQ